MDILSLKKIGLTEGESKVYISLLKIGTSTTGQIIKEAKVSSSKVYDILDRLNKKGLVGTILVHNVKNFEAKDPSRIREFIDLKEKNLKQEKEDAEKYILELQELKKYSETPQDAEILQGTSGIKTFSEIILNKLEKGDTFYILGAPKEASESLSGYFNEWHERRVKKGIYCKILFDEDARDWAEKRRKTPLTKIKYLPNNIKTPALIDIGKGYVATLLFTEMPLCFVIKNNKVAESYQAYFDLLWSISID